MIISPSVLLPLIHKGKLIKNLSKRELSTPEGAGFDLTVGAVYRLDGAGSLLLNTRETSRAIPIISDMVQEEKNPVLNLCGNELYLVTTIETFSLADDMMAIFHPRSTLFRSGVIFQSGVAPFGYKGPMTFLLHVANPAGFKLQIGARFAHVNILAVEGTSFAYRGQWQAGRVVTSGVEEQK